MTVAAALRTVADWMQRHEYAELDLATMRRIAGEIERQTGIFDGYGDVGYRNPDAPCYPLVEAIDALTGQLAELGAGRRNRKRADRVG